MNLERQDNQRQALRMAYLAGILDGEGCFAIAKAGLTEGMKSRGNKSVQHYPKVTCGMVDKPAIYLLKEMFGGSIHVSSVLGKRTIYRWHLTGRHDIINALEAVIPHLLVKKDRAEHLIGFCKGFKSFPAGAGGVPSGELQRREEAWQKMRDFNLVGAAATTKCSGASNGDAIV